MKVSYAIDWQGNEAKHLDDDTLARAERMLTERHAEICRERGIKPLDISDCTLTVWTLGGFVTLVHPIEGVIARAVLLA